MALKHVMINDIISEHMERMQNLKRYYPFFVLYDTVFSQYKEGKYEYLDMGYITVATLRFLINENNFHERDITYEEYEAFLLELLHRDFSLSEEKNEEKELALHIFDKLINDGKAFEFKFYDPDSKTRKTARVRLIESTVKDGKVFYHVTADGIEFYLDTKEIKDESKINIQQLLLEKMIKSDNFKGGIEVVKRINSEVSRLKKEKEDIIKLMGIDVFEGVKAYEEYMSRTAKWFSEEQKLFEKNKALVDKAVEKASYKVTKSNALNDIGALETELKKAILGHSELIKETAALSQISEKIIQGAKYKSLRNVFDFNEALKKIYAADRPEWLEYIIKPFFTPKLVKSFSIKSIDNLLTLKTEDKMAGEKIVKEASVPDFKYDDELMDERTGKNFAVIFKELLERITRWDKVSLKEFNAILEIKFGEEIFENRDFYAFLVHLAGKKRYDMRKITEKQDTMLEEMIVKYMPDSDKENFKDVVFEVIFNNEEMIKTGKMEDDYITDMEFERRYTNG